MQNLTKKTLKIYWQHTLNRKVPTFFFIIFVIIASSLELIPPLYYKKFFDNLTGESIAANQSLLSILLTIVAIHLSVWFFWRISEILSNVYKNYIMMDLSQSAFSYLHGHSVTFFNNTFVGSLVKKVKRFIAGYDKIAAILTWDLIPIAVSIIIIFAILSFTNIWFGIGVLIYAIIMTSFNFAFSKFKLKYDEKRTKAATKWTGHLADSITNQVNVKFFNGKKRESEEFKKVENEVRKLNTITWQLADINEGIQVIIIIALEFGLFYGAIHLWKQGLLSVGDFILIQAYVIQLAHKFWGIGRIMRDYYESMADANEMTEIMEMSHEIKDTRNAKKLEIRKGEIIFEKVNFNYNKTRKIFKNLNLKIKAGKGTALIGQSGAGKTTIVKLLMRMHDVSRGAILIDDQKINKVTQESLWTNISYVPQSPDLFHRTLIENIRYGKPDATDEEVYKAAKLSHCSEFIDNLEDGYNTYVGERGVKLSGGERQRVAIARAILKNSPILILDEATSSLDSESEHLIQDALENLMKNKTVIVIAHRLSTIMKMDNIIVLEKGEIIEQGKHKQLLKKKNGRYKKLWELQVGGFIQ